MTGRELIIYILENGLEDYEVFEDNKFIGFLTIEEVAKNFNVGCETIRTWIKLGYLEGYSIGDQTYIPANAVRKEL